MNNISPQLGLDSRNGLSMVVAGAAVPPAVERDVHGIISRAVSLARETGRDYITQSHAAARAVLAVRPDLSMGQAHEAVVRLRELDAI